MDLRRKLEILADAAKYDASCASSGGQKRDALSGGIGSTTGMGICHSFAPDGRCIALLKILLTNVCVFDCLYCVNRRSSNVPRARFTVDEVIRLTLGFYKRNMIEGLFLSSGIIRTPDHTMEELVRVVRCLRLDHGFRGYIHLKTIAGASPELAEAAGRYADRLSVNMELPTEQGLATLAPDKALPAIRRSMGQLHRRIEETLAERRAPRFAPAGQSTQMIVGADGADDRTLLRASDTLYRRFRLKRVYYSAFSPIPDTSHALPSKAPPLVREHRLYQADWLLRFYGFGVEEIGGAGGMLDLDIDPKLAWALSHRDRFPVDLNAAPREMLLRVPGLGVTTVDRLIDSRRHRRLRLDDLGRMRVPLRKITPFVVTADHRPTRLLDREHLHTLLAPPPEQLSLF